MTMGIYSDGYLDFECIYDTYSKDLILFKRLNVLGHSDVRGCRDDKCQTFSCTNLFNINAMRVKQIH